MTRVTASAAGDSGSGNTGWNPPSVNAEVGEVAARSRSIDLGVKTTSGRRGQVGPAQPGDPAAAARLRGPGSGPLHRADRAFPVAVRRGQHDGGPALDPG